MERNRTYNEHAKMRNHGSSEQTRRDHQYPPLLRTRRESQKNIRHPQLQKHPLHPQKICSAQTNTRKNSIPSKQDNYKSLSARWDKTFLKSAKVPYKTESLLAPSPAKFLRQVENQFVNTLVRRQKKLTETEFENQKNSFLNDADMKQIILCLNLIKDGEQVV